ncbi:MAG TPA: uracil-DNA glycosylase family protein [Cyclobacteriaceae bacterium]
MTLADKILDFLSTLPNPGPLPKGVEVMNPFADANAFALVECFYRAFYDDNSPRTAILGINPGRFGGGITGIPFTDPIKLEKYCGIANDYEKRAELSADFIYRMIEAFGGPKQFYGQLYISAVSPLGFVSNGKNMNYYDDTKLERSLRDFIVTCLKKQLDFPLNRKRCFCLGEGKNFNYLVKLNRDHAFFDEIIPLPHPRFIMQYRRRRVEEFVELYVGKLAGG